MASSAKKILILIVLAAFLSGSVTAVAQSKRAKDDSDPLAGVSLGALKFRGIGPAITSGRISDFAVNPQKPSEYYVATSSGGIWKTVNAGTTYTPIFDSQGSYSIGCITMDPDNHNVVWAGTGENNNQRAVAYGDGVYKSEDGGRSWKNVGLKESEHVGMIAIDPRDSDTVYVAAYGPLWRAGGDRGLYKTMDGGETWEAVLTISEHTGVSEVHMDPRDPDVLYAVAHQRRRHVYTLIDGGPESAVYKSRDGGQNWKKINRGLPSGDLGRIGLAISPADPEYIYAIVEAQSGRGGFYRSLNRGASWERRGSYTSRGNYYQEIVCDPRDPERVYSMDVYMQVSDDGGRTWSALGERSKHVDNHALWIDPDNTDYYLVGCDGGVYESFDRGRTWKYMPNLPVVQFYKVAVDYDEPFYNIYGGTQDNYSLGGPSRTTSANGILNTDWYVTRGGDGFESAIDPEDPDIVYAQSQHGGLVRYDRKSGTTHGIKPKERPGEKAYRWNWDAPLLISPHSHTRLYFAANKLFRSDDRGNTWQVISEDLSRQLDRNKLKVMGKVWPMDAVAKNASTSRYGSIVALDESPVEEGMLYVGTDDGLIQVTEDGGQNWRRIESFPGVPANTYVNEVLASQHERDTVFAAFNNHKNGDFKPYVLMSTDAGRTWNSIASNLPERGSVYALAEDHVAPNLLFAGTEFGVFTSIDRGRHWKKLGAGLPTIAVRDIEIQKRENDLVLATFGRGFFVLDDYTPLRHLTKDVLDSKAFVFPVKDPWMFLQSSPLGGSGKSFQGEMLYNAPNPPVGAVITYYFNGKIKSLEQQREERERAAFKKGEDIPYPTYEEKKAEEQEEISYLILTILDEEDHVVRRLRAPARDGLQRVVWDLRYPAMNPTSERQASPTSSGPSGSPVVPGTYQVKLSLFRDGSEGAPAELPPVVFECKPLGNASLPAKNQAALAAFNRKAQELNRTVNAASAVLRDIGTKVTHFKAALKSLTDIQTERQLYNQIKDLEQKLQEIQIAFSGDRTLGRIDQDAEPGLTSFMRSVVYDSWNSLSAPTQTQQDRLKYVAETFPPLLEKIRALVEIDVKAIEGKLEEIGAPFTPGRLPVIKK
jgi:photosystem II stability/assembly factor-like uncharacterized protein